MCRLATRLRTLVFALPLLALDAAAGPRVIYPDVDTRPPDAVARLRAEPDCASAPAHTLAPGESLTLGGDTTGGTSLVDGYAGFDWDESGPEAVFEITTSATTLLQVLLDAPAADLDVFLLSACDSDACVAGHNAEFLAEIPSGVWYVVVDGYRGAEGAFQLEVVAHHGGLPAAACAGAETLDPATEQTPGNILDRPNLITTAECSSYLAWGGEVWYRITLPPSTRVSLTLGDQPFDAVLWAFEACGDEPTCLAYADAGTSGDPEELEFENLSAAPWEIFLGVDALAPVDSDDGGTVFDGGFVLSTSLTVGSESSTWSALKRRYR